MALPPCHMFCQFYVADGELSCQMYQVRPPEALLLRLKPKTKNGGETEAT